MKDVDCTEGEFDSYLYIITHDLKTFSRAMRVIPEWIEEDMAEAHVEMPRAVSDHISMLQRYARGLDLMLDGLTDLSRVGRLADRASPIPLFSAFEAAWQRVQGRDGFALDLDDVEGTTFGPENDLGRLFFALLNNAVMHHDAPPGQITVRSAQQGERLIVEVEDDGPGIEEGYREKVFEPLYTLRPKDEGTAAGMGLAVARKVLQTLDGGIAIQQASTGRGALVICDLPVSTWPT